MHICVFAVTSLVSFFTDVLSHRRRSLCCGYAARAYSTSFSSVKPLFFFPHSSPRPLGMQTSSWCFFVFFCCELRYPVMYDLAFSSFRRTSCHSPWSLTVMLGYDESHKMQRRWTLFFPSQKRPKKSTHRRSFASFFLFFVPHTLGLCSITYTFKHEGCLIHCEGSQQAAYQCDNQNMPLCALVAPRLEFHFKFHSNSSLVSFFLFPSSAVNLSSCCVHFWSQNFYKKVLNGCFKRLARPDASCQNKQLKNVWDGQQEGKKESMKEYSL